MVGDTLASEFRSHPFPSALIRVSPPQFQDRSPPLRPTSPVPWFSLLPARSVTFQAGPRAPAYRLRPHCELKRADARDPLSPDAASWSTRWCDRFCLRGARIFPVRSRSLLISPNFKAELPESLADYPI